MKIQDVSSRIFRDAKSPGHEGQIQIERDVAGGMMLLGSERRIAVCSCGWHGPRRQKRAIAVLDIERHVAVGDAMLETTAEITSLRRQLDQLKQQVADDAEPARVFREDETE